VRGGCAEFVIGKVDPQAGMKPMADHAGGVAGGFGHRDGHAMNFDLFP